MPRRREGAHDFGNHLRALETQAAPFLSRASTNCLRLASAQRGDVESLEGLFALGAPLGVSPPARRGDVRIRMSTSRDGSFIGTNSTSARSAVEQEKWFERASFDVNWSDDAA